MTPMAEIQITVHGTELIEYLSLSNLNCFLCTQKISWNVGPHINQVVTSTHQRCIGKILG